MNEDIFQDLYEQRLVVLLETDPQTNKYWQVILNAEQFKKVSDSVNNCFPKGDSTGLKPGYEVNILRLSGEEYELPEHIQSIGN